MDCQDMFSLKLDSTKDIKEANDTAEALRSSFFGKSKLLLLNQNHIKSQSNMGHYLKDHLKYKNTAEFYLNNMQGKILKFQMFKLVVSL